MDQPMLTTNSFPAVDELQIFAAIINQYCREFNNWTRYTGVPDYDPELAEALDKSQATVHLKIDFPNSDAELFVPQVYFSITGDHELSFPAWLRHKTGGEVRAIGLMEALEKLMDEAAGQHPSWKGEKSDQYSKDISSIGRVLAERHLATEHQFLPVIERFREMPFSDHQNPQGLAMTWFQQHVQSIIYQASWDFEMEEIFKLIAMLGRHKIIGERALLNYLYQELQSLFYSDPNEMLELILTRRLIEKQGKLFSYSGHYSCLLHNYLHEYYFSEKLLSPSVKSTVYLKYFEQEDVTVTIRPFDLQRDLKMVHEWFHADHAKAIWKMDWPLKDLEHFYRSLLPEDRSHSYIGEVNGEPTFNFEVYWATKDILGDYYEVLPSDYGTHLFIAPTDKKRKFPSLITQSIVSWLFEQKEVGRLVGEGSVDSLAALMNKVHVGFKLQHIIEMPHKKAYLNFCIREWYYEKFPENLT